MHWRSKDILARPRWSKVRALFKSMGLGDDELDKPFIGLANSFSELVPGHYNLRRVAEAVRQGVRTAGGTPLEFGVIAGCDGVANAHQGMRHILPSRELIAASVEAVASAHRLDGLVLLGSCDKIVPGLLMAAARLDLPAIFVNGGPSLGGCQFDGRSSDITSLTEALGMLNAGRLSQEEYAALEDQVMPTCGSCSFLGTANTMCCTAEALGMALPGSATIPAPFAARQRVARQAGRRIVEMVHQGPSARQVITPQAIENAIMLTLALGGSTNAALHIPAIAYEAGHPIELELFDRLSRQVPQLARIYPAAKANVPDFHQVGGVPALLKQLLPLLHGQALSVSGQTMAQSVAGAPEPDGEIIRLFKRPFGSEGGLAVLRGNLAPRGAISKPAAIDPAMRVFKGRARCFDGEAEAIEAILAGSIKPGEVLVLRYEGPKGGPGMPEMAMPMKLLYGAGLALKTALVTDGRFSGTNNGCFVGHVSPEAAEGGPIAAVADGDPIVIDIPQRSLNLEVPQEKIAARLANWRAPAPRVKEGYLALYARLAESADQGAIIRHRLD